MIGTRETATVGVWRITATVLEELRGRQLLVEVSAERLRLKSRVGLGEEDRDYPDDAEDGEKAWYPADTDVFPLNDGTKRKAFGESLCRVFGHPGASVEAARAILLALHKIREIHKAELAEQAPKKRGPVDLGTAYEPLPQQSAIGYDFLPRGYPTSFTGTEAVAKSLYALYQALCLLTGRECLGQEVTQVVSILYADWELNEEELTRRAYKVARGMGLKGVPRGLHYLDMAAEGSFAAAFPALRRYIAELEVEHLIIDSFSFAGVTNEETAIEAFALLKPLSPEVTTTILDHQARVQPGGKYQDMRGYGSRFKEAGVRSAWQVEKADPDQHVPGRMEVLFTDKKSTFSAKRKDIGVRITFGKDADGEEFVRFEAINPETSSALSKKLSRSRQVLLAVGRLEAPTSAEVAAELDIKEDDARTTLSRLMARKALVRTGKGGQQDPFRYHPVATQPATSPESTSDGLLHVNESTCNPTPSSDTPATLQPKLQPKIATQSKTPKKQPKKRAKKETSDAPQWNGKEE